jgi:MFS family permease
MTSSWHLGLGRELGLAFWALTFVEASFGAYASVWPLWIERLGAPITIVGLVLASSGVVRPFVVGSSSWLMDRVDTRTVLIAARILTALGLVFAALVRSWELLLITVITNSFGELVFPAMHSHVAEHAGDNPTRAFNMVITIGPAIALIVTPLLSGLIIAWVGIPGALIFAALLGILATACLALANLPRRVQPGDDVQEKASYRAVIQHAPSRRIIVLHGLTIISLGIGASLIPNFLKDQRGIDAGLISILSSGAAVGTLILAFVSMRSQRLLSAPILGAAIAAGLAATGYFMFATLDIMPVIAIAYVLRGGVFSAWALFLAAMSEVASPRLRTRSFALMEILGGTAMSFGPVVASMLYDLEPPLFLWVSGVATFVMVTVMLLNQRAIMRDRVQTRLAGLDLP